MMSTRSAAVGVAAVIAASLSGCGGSPVTTVPPTPSPIAPAPAINPEMFYMGVGEITEINQDACKPDGNFADSDIGTKMPDECCVVENWKTGGVLPESFWGGVDADVLTKPGATDYSKCYVRVAPWPFDGTTGATVYDGEWIRNYIGCENGELIASEECFPSGQIVVTKALYDADPKGAYDYPMTKAVGDTKFEDKTAAECGCNIKDNSPNFVGAGCFIASANLAKIGGSNPAVFLKVSGTCPAEVTV